MLFSIVVPVFNAENTIDECLTSLRNQTFRDFEVVLVDDGSSDSSSMLCGRYCSADSRFRLIGGENQGCYLARIRGAEHASGEYLLFVDADDCLNPEALKKCADVIHSGSYDMVTFLDTYNSSRAFDGNRVGLSEGVCNTEGALGLKWAVCGGRFNSMCAKAVKREVFFQADIARCQPGEVVFAEDLYMLLPIVERVRSMYFIEEALYYYRQHSGSFSGSFSLSQVRSLALVMPVFADYACRWGEDYLPFAANGILRQYCHVVKIASFSRLERAEFVSAVDALSASLREMPEFVLGSVGKERPDNRVLLYGVLRGRYSLIRIVAKSVEVVKKALSWRRWI